MEEIAQNCIGRRKSARYDGVPRRKSPRYGSVPSSVKMVLQEKVGYSPFEAKLIDCSKHGAQFISEDIDLKVGDRIIIQSFKEMVHDHKRIDANIKRIDANIKWVVERGNIVKFGSEFLFPSIGFPVEFS